MGPSLRSSIWKDSSIHAGDEKLSASIKNAIIVISPSVHFIRETDSAAMDNKFEQFGASRLGANQHRLAGLIHAMYCKYVPGEVNSIGYDDYGLAFQAS